MNIFEDTSPRLLSELLGEIHTKTSVLPDFQRDFVWEPNATQELISSIANNYPAGSILRVRDLHNVFATRIFEGAPDPNRIHTFLVLDGQQRLTSLYQAFYGVGEHRYFVDLEILFSGSDFEEAIFHESAKSKWVVKLEANIELQVKELILPLAVLMGKPGGFWNWSNEFQEFLQDDIRGDFKKKILEAYEKWFKPIEYYNFPVITLSKDTQADALCIIFETLNRTGVKLNVFELLTARFWPQNIRLRTLWESARTENPILEDFDVDPYYMLQAVALAGRETPSCKRRDVLDLEPAVITKWWDRVAGGMAEGLEILQDDCKVMMPKWVPYQTMLAPLAASLASIDHLSGPAVGAARAKIRKWIWCSIFGQSYESAPNTQSAKDVTELKSWIGGGKPPESVSKFNFDAEVLRDVTPRQRALYRGTICLIVGSGSGARDFHTGSPITRTLIESEQIDDHHVFPDNYLKTELGIVKAGERDCVLNRTLIDRKTNQVIQDRRPSVYLAEIRVLCGIDLSLILGSHLLPSSPISSLSTDDYKQFIDDRLALIKKEIERVTG